MSEPLVHIITACQFKVLVLDICLLYLHALELLEEFLCLNINSEEGYFCSMYMDFCKPIQINGIVNKISATILLRVNIPLKCHHLLRELDKKQSSNILLLIISV